MSEVTIIFGCMFSGKSDLLLNIIKDHIVLSRRIFAVTSVLDDRYSKTPITDNDKSFITTHDQAKYPCTAAGTLAFLLEKDLTEIDLLVIEEGQFFDDIRDTVLTLAGRYTHLKIVIATLDLNYDREPWESVKQLILEADVKIHRRAICKDCNNGVRNAAFSHLKSNTNMGTTASAPVEESTTQSHAKVLVGESDLYEPLCRKHYLQKNAARFMLKQN